MGMRHGVNVLRVWIEGGSIFFLVGILSFVGMQLVPTSSAPRHFLINSIDKKKEENEDQLVKEIIIEETSSH